MPKMHYALYGFYGSIHVDDRLFHIMFDKVKRLGEARLPSCRVTVNAEHAFSMRIFVPVVVAGR